MGPGDLQNTGARMKRCVVFLAMVVALSNAVADQAAFTPEKVLTGNSSAFSDGVFVRVAGQVGAASCYYAGLASSMFYVRNGGVLDPKKALALLLSAKLSGRSIEIMYSATSTQTDFWGYGITSCEISELAIN